MATFVLVHGAWRGGWCWKRVRRLLQASGHEVFTPTLTGLGARAHLLRPGIALDTHVADVANLLRSEELSDVVLCGHSYAGCVVTGVADLMPERLRALVFLDAVFLEDGECFAQHLPDQQYRQLLAAAKTTGEGWKVPPPPAALFDVNVADRAWVDRQCTMHPLAAFEQPISLVGSIERVADILYVRAGAYADSPFGPFYERAVGKGWRTATIESGHDIMIDRPDALSRILIEAAENRG